MYVRPGSTAGVLAAGARLRGRVRRAALAPVAPPLPLSGLSTTHQILHYKPGQFHIFCIVRGRQVPYLRIGAVRRVGVYRDPATLIPKL